MKTHPHLAVFAVFAAASVVLTPPAISQREAPPDAGTGACLTCHTEMKAGEEVHEPVKTEKCNACHTYSGQGHRFEKSKTPGEKCVVCHKDPGKDARHVHGPVAAGECTACHDPHSSDYVALLKQGLPDLCWSCHGRTMERGVGRPAMRDVRKEIEEAPIRHPPAEANCDSCHPAHASTVERLFTRAFPSGPHAAGYEARYALCFACHRERLLSADPDATRFRTGDRNLHAVHVAQHMSRSCALCHSPHGAGPHLIRTTVKFGTWDMPINFGVAPDGGSCQPACHERREYHRPVPQPTVGQQQSTKP